METSYKELIQHRNQINAEIDSLRLLWSGTVRTFTPDIMQFAAWLRMVGYTEVTRAVNDVARFFIKREGVLLPGQLIRAMDRNVTHAMLRQKAAQR